MEYTPTDAKENMESLIAGLKRKFNQLTTLMNSLASFDLRVEINNLRMKVSIEIHHRELLAAFDAASAQVIRPPTAQEVAALQDTLGALDRDLSSLGSFQAIVSFVEDVMTQNAGRFMEILSTIKMNA
jgi:hypothetical protein